MQNKQPKVSVIITTYNRKELLKETLDSILNQTYADFELIVVDNFSNYDFFKYMQSFGDERINAFRNHNNGIIAINRNYGIMKAKGEFIAFCDDDDLWVENKLEKQLPFLKQKSFVGVGSTTIKFNGTKNYISKQIKKNKILSFKQLFYISAPLSSLIVKNEGVYFDNSNSYCCVEDADFQLQLTFKTKQSIIILTEPLVYYRIHNQNESKIKLKKNNFFNVLEKHKKNITNKEYTRKLAHLHFTRAFLLMKHNKGNTTFHLRKSIINGNFKIKSMSIFLLVVKLLPNNIKKYILNRNQKIK
jgi:teichuronic acid biosynthesis glycosyltransferase TuaG